MTKSRAIGKSFSDGTNKVGRTLVYYSVSKYFVIFTKLKLYTSTNITIATYSTYPIVFEYPNLKY